MTVGIHKIATTGSLTARGETRDLWNQSRISEIRADKHAGLVVVDDDFFGVPTGYTITQVTNGTFNTNTGYEGGAAIADSAGALADEGVNIQLGTAACVTPAADTTIIFEARVNLHDTGTAGDGLQFFLGLSEYSATVVASGVNSSANHLGFEALVTDAMSFQGEKAGVRGSVTGVYTVVDSDVTDTWVKLGFKVNGITSVDIWVDGVKNASSIAAANIPIVALTPTLVVQAEAGDPLVWIDWWKCVKSYRTG